MLALAGVGVLVTYALQTHDRAPVGDRLRYRPPTDGDPYLPDDPALAAGAGVREGRTYVPAYSHAYAGTGTPVLFAVTLSLRNVDPTHPLRVRRVDYHATAGERVRAFLDEPRVLPPLGTAEYFVDETDEAGGSGANFIVEWSADASAHPPRIEAVMIGRAHGLGYSFSTIGVDVSETDASLDAVHQ